METNDLLPHELLRLKNIAKKNLTKVILYPLFSILASMAGLIPLKYIPERWRDVDDHLLDDSFATLVGFNYYLLFMLIWAGLMIWAALATYKNFSIKKDLKFKKKKTVEGTISRVDAYEGEPYVRLKKGTGVNILHFDETNYRPLKVGDKILFEVYEHSNILIRILNSQAKVVEKKMAKVIEVKDKCPACNHLLSPEDKECPDCGLNFS